MTKLFTNMRFNSLAAILTMILAVTLLFTPIPLSAQSNLKQPTVSTTGLLNVTWTAGTVNNGGHAVAIVAGSLNVSATQADCAPPLYAACNFVYANSSGTVTSSTTLATAGATGNTILALAEANGTVITKLSFPLQNSAVGRGALGLNGVSFYECAANTCSPALKMNTSAHVFAGITDALNAASPAIATVTGISPAFTGTTTFHCTATLNGTAAAGATGALEINYVSGSSFTITAGNGVSATASYICVGY